MEVVATERRVRTPPPANGSVVRFTEMAPGAEDGTHASHGRVVDVGGVVLEGETWLLLDDGLRRASAWVTLSSSAPNDAWANRRTAPRADAFVLIDATVSEELRRRRGRWSFDQDLD